MSSARGLDVEITVQDKSRPELRPYRILWPAEWWSGFMVMNAAAHGGRDVLLRVTGPDSEEAAARLHDLMQTESAPDEDVYGGVSAMGERQDQCKIPSKSQIRELVERNRREGKPMLDGLWDLQMVVNDEGRTYG